MSGTGGIGMNGLAAKKEDEKGKTVVEICVGSSCHMKGSYDVIQTYRALIAEHGLQDRVVLKASFCMKSCTNGIAMRIDEKPVTGVSAGNCAGIFRTYVLGK